MPEVHLYQWLVAFGAAMWLTARWLLTAPGQRWRHVVAALVSTLLWIPVAYTAPNVAVSSAGVTTRFGSTALALFCVFMVVVSIAGLVVGLYLWVEREVDDASEELPDHLRRGRRGD